jgi:phosphatidyl-myo-inositol dimannoside synthase
VSRPRVLVLTPDFPPARGGIQVLTHRIVSSWERVEPVVVTLDHVGAEAFDARQPFPVVRVPSPTRGAARASAIVALNLAALRTARATKPSAVLASHIVTGPAAALLRRWSGLPWLQYVHAKEVGARPGLAAFAVRRADVTVAVSRYTRSLALAAGAPPARVRTVNPGVDLPDGDDADGERAAAAAAPGDADALRLPSPRRAHPIETPGERPTILTIARLEDRYKGHDVLLRALPLVRAQIPAVRWAVIGDGPLRRVLERGAAMLDLGDAVEFLGAVDDAERDAWLERAHVFAMASRLPAGGYAGEGFGIVYLEANAHGLPAVAGGVGGATDAVVHERTGLLVDPEDHVAVAQALTRLLRDRDLARELGRGGHERAQSFAWPHVSREVEGLLLELIDPVAAGPAAGRA